MILSKKVHGDDDDISYIYSCLPLTLIQFGVISLVVIILEIKERHN